MSAKYYVESGELLKIVETDSPLLAAQKSLLLAEGETIDPFFFFVDERGFRGLYNSINTTDLLPEFVFSHKDVYQIAGDDLEEED